jgi:hypothetical protein
MKGQSNLAEKIQDKSNALRKGEEIKGLPEANKIMQLCINGSSVSSDRGLNMTIETYFYVDQQPL